MSRPEGTLALGKGTHAVLDEAIKLGLAQLPDPYGERPPITKPAASSRHGAQRDAATGDPPTETPGSLHLSPDEEA